MHDWSIISRAAGTMPLAITADTASPAVRSALKSASRVRMARGTGSRRTLIRVAMPKLPSEPTNRPTRSGPQGSPPGLPSWTIRPSASTTSRLSTWFAVTPYLRQCGPPEFSATLPPIVQAVWLDGSGLYSRPCGAAAAERRTFTTPGSTTAIRFLGSIARMRFSRVSTSSTASASASAPPDRPVPAPRGTNGTPSAASSRTTATTSSRLPGSTTTPGTRRWVGSPSRAYVIRSGSARAARRRSRRAPRPATPLAPPARLPLRRSRGALDLGVAAAAPVAPRPSPHRRPALGVGRDGTQHGRELAQPGAGAPDRLQRLLRRRVELERRRDLEREELGIGRQLDLLVLSLGEDPECACEAPEAVPHVCGERGHLGGIARIVVEFLDLGDPVRARARDPVPQYETTLANGEDIGTPVGERLVRLDEGDAADVARIRYGIGVRRGVGRHVGDPEPPVTGETVLQQLAVARLEDVQWLGGPGEQDNRKGKNWKLPAHVNSIQARPWLDAQTHRGERRRGARKAHFLTPHTVHPCASVRLAVAGPHAARQKPFSA